MNILVEVQDFIIGIFKAGADNFVEWMVEVVPIVLMILILMNAVGYMIGEKRLQKLSKIANKNVFVKYMILPFVSAIAIGNPLCLALGKVFPERYKPSYIASATYFCHTSNGVFSHINPAELLIWLGIARGIETLGLSTAPLAIRYLLVGLVVNFISGIVTDYTTSQVMKKKHINLSDELVIETKEAVEIEEDSDYQAVKVIKGLGGFGGPLIIQPTAKRNKIVYITGGKKHPIVDKLEQLTSCKVVNGFETTVDDQEICAAIIDCGGTLRCGIYPKKKIPTINVLATGKSGPLAKYITEDIYVSAVGLDEISRLDDSLEDDFEELKPKVNVGFSVGKFISIFFKSGKDSVETMISTIIPLIAVVSLFIGIINGTGIAVVIAETMKPLITTGWGLMLIGVICAIPFLAPILAPGAVVGQIVGALIGVQIGLGVIDPTLALPALFAINTQAACDFIPVALGLAEAKSETIEVGVQSVLYSRFITSFLRVGIAWLCSMGMY